MIRFALVLVAVFVFFGILRIARLLLAAPRGSRRPAAKPPEAEMVRDPVCGTWIDRRLALLGRRGGEAVPVCSDSCRRRLEAG